MYNMTNSYAWISRQYGIKLRKMWHTIDGCRKSTY